MQFWAIVVDSFRESVDRKFFWVIVAVTLFVVLGMASVDFAPEHVSLMFGAWKVDSDVYNPESVDGQARILGMVIALMDFFLGWIGVLLMIVATAGFFPTFMERGAIDVVLAKPIGRARLFLYKYLASLVFVLLQAALFATLSFLVMGLHWGVWVPRYLVIVPLLVLLFSYLYCVSVLVGVVTRSAVAAILLSVAAWVVFVVPPKALDMFETMPGMRAHQGWYRAVQVAAWVPPKTGDIPYLAARFTRAGTGVDIMPDAAFEDATPTERIELERARQVEQRRRDVNPWKSVGSSLLFEGLVVGSAVIIFRRRDF